jgi:hypothetical protein
LKSMSFYLIVICSYVQRSFIKTDQIDFLLAVSRSLFILTEYLGCEELEGLVTQ